MSDTVFLSYTHIKDFHGVVSEFRTEVERELRKKTGKPYDVFQDLSHIGGGERWNQTLEQKLKEAKLLLILFSPTWLKSKWCQKEYRIFREHDAACGINRPVVPLMWDEVVLEDAEGEEEAALFSSVMTHQLVVWKDLQYQNWKNDSPLRLAISRLADTLKARLRGPR